MSDVIFENHHSQPRRQAFIIPLTYADISTGAADIPRISHGGDVWEVWADLLSPSGEVVGKSNLPPLEYVRDQLRLLRRLSKLPVLFTIRTVSQGGKWPDKAESEALAMMLMAAEEGCQYIDVEIEWSPDLIDKLVANKGASKLVASYHDWTGTIRWTGSVLQQKYAAADAFGDIVKLSILSADIYDCHELSLFVRKHLAESPKPLLAVGMGQHGQLSRVTSPISLVTHSLIPTPSAPGQLTLAEVHRAKHLIGQLPQRQLAIYSSDDWGRDTVKQLQAGFAELGLPHQAVFLGQELDEDVAKIIQEPKFGGAAVTGFQGFKRQDFLTNVSEDAERAGFVDTILPESTESTETPTLSGENVSWRVIYESVLESGLDIPIGSSAAIIGNKAAAVRATCLAVERLGYKSVHIVELGLRQEMAAKFANLGFTTQTSKINLILYGGEDTNGCVLQELTSHSTSGVVIDLGCSTGSCGQASDGWKVIDRGQFLARRASLLFSLWTGRRAPECVMHEAA